MKQVIIRKIEDGRESYRKRAVLLTKNVIQVIVEVRKKGSKWEKVNSYCVTREDFNAFKRLFEKEIEIPRMDYFKWQMREDLVGKYLTTDIEKAEERARGWNALRDWLKKIKEETKEAK